MNTTIGERYRNIINGHTVRVTAVLPPFSNRVAALDLETGERTWIDAEDWRAKFRRVVKENKQ